MSTKRKYDAVKRVIDIVGAGTGLVLLSPVIGATALIVRAKLGLPVIFEQDRPGRDGKIFKLYKFRSMLNADETTGLVSDADRLTSFGKALRSTSLDELPSLLNVLRGDMSLVGPRPLLVAYLDRYTPEQTRRHEVRPGVTGLAQVSGRNLISWDEKFAMDIEYVDRRSFLLDVKVLWRTIRAVFVREGVSHDGHATMEEFVGSSRAN
ncbi:sugar transferase [Paeniglutamicibacter sulfureus]|uniref:Lipopolysaccharide/colanic/teichoic acid biosynthesis glycosyltransferase n=1 Tax=Paeniglutamicibacter sulfureus TaxID=43666 RepID=A0ABU2BNS5_9MICC|nr:sugar transferase [Paeniglutamicibacter sulfureus]MDR7359906.1 lipopolysaccharide/colanic/teichoic acid biosynthesis glycosyltransferase [Paeniglutamicibacter sulfureus]